MTATTTARPASDKQRAFALRLLTEKDTTRMAPDLSADARREALTIAINSPAWTTRNASDLIDRLLALPRLTAAPAVDPAQPGYYLRDERVYVVVQAKTTGNLYAKVLVLGDGQARWEYAHGAHRTLNAAEVLTAADAARLGHLHGFCVRCCKPLTDVRSNAAGYGETCARKMGWPYPTAREAQALLAA